MRLPRPALVVTPDAAMASAACCSVAKGWSALPSPPSLPLVATWYADGDGVDALAADTGCAGWAGWAAGMDMAAVPFR